MPRYIYMTTCLLLVLSACGGTKEVRQTVIPDNFQLSLERTMCFGRCPAYTLQVDDEGAIEYKAVRFAPEPKHVRSRLNTSQLRKLVYTLKQANMFQYEDSYDNPNVSDLPAVKLACTLEKGTKDIYLRMNTPAKLDSLVMNIEELVFRKMPSN
ncbi:MAG: DUF6438 domain-containing protein [Bacteroidia bacterium]